MGFLAWIIVGLIAGWLAGQVMKGGGYGILVDIILGILGGVVGGWIFGLLGIWPGGGMIGSIIVPNGTAEGQGHRNCAVLALLDAAAPCACAPPAGEG